MKKSIAKTVFISRKLKKKSVFLDCLTASGYRVLGESLVAFSPVAFPPPPSTDWIFFYSRHSVRYFFEQLNERDIRPESRLACMGSGTASTLRRYCSVIDFIGQGQPQAVADAFVQQAKGQRVLFPQARQSRRSVQQLLEGRIRATDLVVYDNRKRDDFELPFCDVLVFTSPLNVEAYLDKYPIREDQRVVAIGSVTARRLRSAGVQQVEVAAQPTEQRLAEQVLGNPDK